MSFNKFASIRIGGTNINTISDTYNGSSISSSFNCLGNSLISGDSIIKTDLYLGNETIDTSGNIINTGGSIKFKIGGVSYTLTPQILSFLSTISSNIQTQINNITSSGGALVGANNNFTGSNSFFGTTTFSNSVIVNGANISIIEFSYLDGLTSNAQTQLNNKAGLGANTFTAGQTISSGNLTLSNGVFQSTGSGGAHVWYKYLDNSKYWNWNTTNTNHGFWNTTGYSIFFNGDGGTASFQGLTSCNGGLTVPSGQTTNLYSPVNFFNDVIVNGSNISTVEFSYLDGLTSNAQSQLNGKCNTSGFSTTQGSSCFFSASATYPNTTRTHVLNELRVVNNTIPSGGFTGNLSSSIGNGFLLGWNAGGAGGIAHFINSTDLGGTSGFRFYNYTNAGVYQSTSLILNSNGSANFPNLLTCDGGLTIPSTKILTLTGNISANSLTITPLELSYLDGLTGNIQTQINSITGGSGSYATLSGTQSFTGNNTFTGDTFFSKLDGFVGVNNGTTMEFSGGSTLYISPTGSLNVNGIGVNSTQLSYALNLTSDAQTQIDSKANLFTTPQLETNNTFTGINYFNSNDVYMCHPTATTTFRLRSSKPATQIELFPETTSRISLGSSSGNPMIQLNETQFINGSVNNVSTLTFPLYKHYIYRGTTFNFTITLPLVSAIHEGYSIKIFKTASNALSQIITINTNASNRILESGSMTELTSSTLILGAGKTNCELAICILQSGLYGWVECDNSILNTSNTWGGSNTFSSSFTTNGTIVANGGITMNGSGNVLTFGFPIINSLTASELYNLKSTSSNIQTQLNTKANLTSLDNKSNLSTIDNTFTNVNTFNQRIFTLGVEPLTAETLNLGTQSINTINIGNFTTANTFRFNNTLDLFKSTNIGGDITLDFPLANSYLLRNFTGAVNITLPLVSAFHIGKQVNFIRANSSLTNVITFTPNASNRIVESGTITEQTTNNTILGSGQTSTTLTIGLLQSGLYGWIEISNSNKKNSANTYTEVQTFSIPPVMSGSSISSNTIPESSIVGGLNSVCRNTGNETWGGVKTFSSIPQLATQGTADNDMINYLTFRKNFGGVFMITLQGSTDIRTAVLNSKADLATNLYNQAITSGVHSSPQSGTAVGTWNTGSSLLLKDSKYLVYPNFGLIVYNALNYGGTIILNFKNTTSSPVFVRTTADNTGRSIKVYFNNVELT